MRMILRLIGALLLLGVVAIAVPILLAHRQIRTIDPPLPSPGAVVIAVAEGAGPSRVFHVNTYLQQIQDGRISGAPAFILEWPDGRRFMIDVGMDSETALEFGRGSEMAFGAGPATALGTVASQLGAETASVAGLGFTHLHHDHTQGIVALCEARPGPLSVFQSPFQFTERNHTTDMGFRYLEDAMALPSGTGCGQPVALAASPQASGDGAIYPIPGFPGLVAIAAGGHTPGSTIFFARIGAEYFLFSGDITNSRRDLVENRPKSKIYSGLIVPEFPDRLAKLRIWVRDFDRRSDVTAVVSHDQLALGKIAIPAWVDLESDP